LHTYKVGFQVRIFCGYMGRFFLWSLQCQRVKKLIQQNNMLAWNQAFLGVALNFDSQRIVFIGRFFLSGLHLELSIKFDRFSTWFSIQMKGNSFGCNIPRRNDKHHIWKKPRGDLKFKVWAEKMGLLLFRDNYQVKKDVHKCFESSN